MNLKRSFLKRKARFQKWKDRLIFQFNKDLYLDRFRDTLESLNKTIPPINVVNKNVKFIKNIDIPALAWGVKVDTTGNALVNYGPNVHVFDNGVVEGVWDDDFQKLNFKDASHFFGSGLLLGEDGLTITPPSHFYEGVFLFHNYQTGMSYFSNSLNYVLLENAYLLQDNYEAIATELFEKNNEITAKGVFKVSTELCNTKDYAIHVFYYHNVLITEKGCSIKPKQPPVPQYKNFDQYRAYLLKVLHKLNDNANSPIRVQKYPSLATLSSGYDSSAVAALLVDVGQVEAVTIDVNIAGNEDSGLELAGYLGIPCTPCSHPLAIEDRIANLGTFNYTDDFADETSEFLATVGHGDDIVLKAFDEYLGGKTVYTGHSGDDVWSFKSLDFIGIPVDIINAKSLSEYRLRKNFFHVPLPVIGAVYPFILHKINFELNTRKFWVDDNYNRPIPRRIVEEKGVPRGAFAKSKRSTNPYILNTNQHKPRAFSNIMKRYSWKDQIQ